MLRRIKGGVNIKATVKNIISVFITAVMLLNISCFCIADSGKKANTENIEIIFTDVTDIRPDVLEGEAKIMVSVKGASGIASIMQTSLKFSGDLKYKSITFLKGQNNPPHCFLYSPNAALTNSKKTLMPSIISTDGSIKLSDTTDLFILTFDGNPGDTVTLTLDEHLDNTYCVTEGVEQKVSKNISLTATASEKAAASKIATVKLTMDVITDFAGPAKSGYNSSGIELRITGEKNTGYTLYTVLNNANLSKGGHRVGTGDISVPTFLFENTVLADDTYTVEISGIGYIPYTIKNVTFDDVLEITNKNFVPGDIDGDGNITPRDKRLFNTVKDNKDYSEACDFNRDQKVDRYDQVIFKGISDVDETEITPEIYSNPHGIKLSKRDGNWLLSGLPTGLTVNYIRELFKIKSGQSVGIIDTDGKSAQKITTECYVIIRNSYGESVEIPIAVKYDASCDGEITMLDLNRAMNLTKYTSTTNKPAAFYSIDTNLDGKIDINEITVLLRMFAVK